MSEEKPKKEKQEDRGVFKPCESKPEVHQAEFKEYDDKVLVKCGAKSFMLSKEEFEAKYKRL